ncbi:MAG: diguanylate cyclase [Mycolicibacterium sp.]|uniref:GGDEF domain-containing protein n=1 Tax=Mycolicibacterium sp. TaxID=2320850 RepID=UPI003D111EDF
MTATLATRGLQLWVCRLVAVSLALLGLIPLALMLSGLETRLSWVVAGIVFVACLALSAFWLQSGWPTRGQSLASILVGSLAVGVSALIAPSPVIGLLSSVAFVVPATFAVFLHTPRVLAVVWPIVAAVVWVLFARSAPAEFIEAIWATAMVVVLNIFSAVGCWGVIRMIQPDSVHGDIEQLTGLLHREAFYRRVATLLASRSRSHDQYFVLVAVKIDSFSLLLGEKGARAGIKARVSVAQALRETVRHNAVVAHIADDVFLVADTFTTTDASPLVERIRGAIAVTPQHLTASIGVVCTPLAPLAVEPPDVVVDTLIEVATAAIEEARKAGGDQVRYIVLPSVSDGRGPGADLTA